MVRTVFDDSGSLHRGNAGQCLQLALWRAVDVDRIVVRGVTKTISNPKSSAFDIAGNCPGHRRCGPTDHVFTSWTGRAAEKEYATRKQK